MWHTSKLDQVKEDAKRLTNSLMALAEDEFAVGESKVREMGDKASRKWEEAREVAIKEGRAADAWAHNNVWKTAAISAAAGALLALLASRHTRK